MNIEQYQEQTRRTWNADLPRTERINNAILGIAGESGELVESWKKHRYHGHAWDADDMSKELGDLLYYVARMADEIGCSLPDVLDANIAKLRERYADGFSSAASIERVDVR